MMERFQAIELKRAVRGFRAMVVDTRHPSGAPAVMVRYFKTIDEARRAAAAASQVESIR